jgi:peptidoglycan/LPS O-acetylase OafA/YrhL
LDQVQYAFLYVYDFFFATNIVKNHYFLDHLWSLSVEEQFYIFWPLLILLVPEKALKKLALSFIVLGPLFRLIFLFIYRSGEFRFLANPVEWFIYPLPVSQHRCICLWRLPQSLLHPASQKTIFSLVGCLADYRLCNAVLCYW